MPNRSPLFFARIAVLGLAVLAFAMVCASGPFTRAEIWSWQTGIAMLRWATMQRLASSARSEAVW